MMKVRLFLIICIFASIFSNSATAQSFGYYEYEELIDNTVVIRKYNGKASEIQIPSELEGKTVTAIGNRAFYMSDIRSIVIPTGVKCIDEEAFYLCSSLEDVLIADSVVRIADDAFAYCSSLTSIVVPNSVTDILGNPFAGCSKLECIRISSNHPTLEIVNGSLFDKQKKRLVWYPRFYTDTSFCIPQGTLEIGKDAFQDCRALSSVSIPDSVVRIEEGAFSGCSGLLNIVIPDSVVYIGNKAFSNCNSLTSITIPESVIELGGNPFQFCEHLISVRVGDEHPCFATIEGVLFDKRAKSLIWYPESRASVHYNIPSGIRIIGEASFSRCRNLVSVTIPDSISHIEDKAFAGCNKINQFVLPSSVKAIGDYAFYECDGLESIVIPEGVETIGMGVFSDCDNLKSVVVPESVSFIGDYAFPIRNISVIVKNGSYAHQYALAYNIPFELTYNHSTPMDWLNQE